MKNNEKKRLIFGLNQVPPIFPICPKNSHFQKKYIKKNYCSVKD
jgi:hypothetical protein